jgi:phosphoglycolate phosphatase
VSPTVVLDLDGTLVDSAPDLADGVNALLERREAEPVGADDVRAFIGGGAVKLIRNAFAARRLPIADGEIDALYREFRAAYDPIASRTTRPYPGVLPTLDRLRATGHRLALCTNKPEGPSRLLLDALFLSSRLDAAVYGDTLPEKKPDPAPILEAIHRAGGRPDDAVMVGDSDADVLGARAAGLPVIAASWGYGVIAAKDLGADVVIDAFAELPDALARVEPLLRARGGALSPSRSPRE